MRFRHTRSTLGSATLTVGVFLLLLGFATPAVADSAFQPQDIEWARFYLDVAELTAHRYVGGDELNHVELVDINNGLGVRDLSPDLFGTVAWPNPALVSLSPSATGILPIPDPAPDPNDPPPEPWGVTIPA